jgi:hypothetical protein
MPVYPDGEPMNPERLELSTNGLKADVTADYKAFYEGLTDEQFMLTVCLGIVLSEYLAALQNERVEKHVVARIPDLAKALLDGVIKPARPTDDQIRETKAEMHRIIRAAIAEATE